MPLLPRAASHEPSLCTLGHSYPPLDQERSPLTSGLVVSWRPQCWP